MLHQFRSMGTMSVSNEGKESLLYIMQWQQMITLIYWPIFFFFISMSWFCWIFDHWNMTSESLLNSWWDGSNKIGLKMPYFRSEKSWTCRTRKVTRCCALELRFQIYSNDKIWFVGQTKWTSNTFTFHNLASNHISMVLD